MDEIKAKKIGETYALIAVLVCHFLILAFFNLQFENFVDPLWIFINLIIEAPFQFGLTLLIMILLAVRFGRIAGKKIILGKEDYALIGIKTLVFILFSGIFIGYSISMIYNGIIINGETFPNALFKYLLNPFALIFVLLLVPVCIVGAIYGYLLNKKKLESHNHKSI